MPRKATIERKTKETDIKISVPFMDHMFSHIAKHGFFDVTIKAKGDTEIDDHHTVEDLGIAFGQAIKKSLGDSKGIRRYGDVTVPMDETLAQVVMDLSGRPYLAYQVELPKKYKLKDFDPGLAEDFRCESCWDEPTYPSHLRPRRSPYARSHLQGIRPRPRSGHDRRSQDQGSAFDEGKDLKNIIGRRLTRKNQQCYLDTDKI
jgi:imidazoleglycerol-phosphate dehydratase